MKHINKGFTLIELLGVLAVLALLSLVVVPAVQSGISRSRETAYQTQVNSIINASKNWVADHIERLPKNHNEKIGITLLELKKGGYIDKNIRNPKTGEIFSDNLLVVITKVNENFTYEIKDVTDLSPTLLLIGSKDIYLDYGDEYQELGVDAKTNNGEEITEITTTIRKRGEIVDSVDSSKYGIYTITYQVVDNGIVVSVERKVHIIDLEPPTITLEENTTLSIDVTSFNALDGVSATDNSGEEVAIEVNGNVSLGLPGTYYLTYKATDEYGNFTTKKRIVTIEKEDYKDESGANKPDLLDNMIPIKYDGTNWVYADTNNKWYDYNKKEWANAVVLNTGVTKNVGDTISEDEVSLWYVWIPRYKYQLFNVENTGVPEQEIAIQFESGTETTGTVSCTTASNGVETCTNAVKGNWYTHPAFTFGDQQLTGLWVGKFEVSTSDDTCNGNVNDANCNKELPVTIKPGVSSWRYSSVSNFFNSIQKMSNTYSITDGDSHMMKNSEWGAVAYLKQSKYGLGTTDIAINANVYITGGGTGTAYKNTDNVKQSTTGNVYGVYDMSLRSWVFVMGNMVNSSGAFYSSKAGFTTAPESKYYDVYSYDGSRKTHARGHLGDATKETLKTFGDTSGGWYSNSAGFPNSSDPWFIRGGGYNVVGSAGVFGFVSGYGTSSNGYSARAVLARR